MKKTAEMHHNYPEKQLGNSGQTLVEYGLLLVLIAVVLIAILTVLGGDLNTRYSTITTTLP